MRNAHFLSKFLVTCALLAISAMTFAQVGGGGSKRTWIEVVQVRDEQIKNLKPGDRGTFTGEFVPTKSKELSVIFPLKEEWGQCFIFDGAELQFVGKMRDTALAKIRNVAGTFPPNASFSCRI